MESSKMTFRLDRTYPDSGRKNIWKADFRCHHNTRNRKTVGKRKNTDCKSTLTIIVKRVLEKTRSTDPYIKEWPTIVIIKMFHNHPLNSAPALKYRSVSKVTEKKLLELFRNGHTPLSALKAHKVDLMLEHGDNYTSVSEDRMVCPDQSYCYRLYYKKIGRNVKSDDKPGHSIEDIKTEGNVPPKKKRKPRKKRVEKTKLNQSELGVVVLSVPQTNDETTSTQNITIQKNDSTSVIVQSLPVAHIDELQAAVQALEHGGSYGDLQAIGLAFSQSQPIYTFQPLKDHMYPSKRTWTPQEIQINDVHSVEEYRHGPITTPPAESNPQSSQASAEQPPEQFNFQNRSNYQIPLTETLVMPPAGDMKAVENVVPLTSSEVEIDSSPQLQNTNPQLHQNSSPQLQTIIAQTSLPQSTSQNIWQELPPPPPHVTQATVSIPSQHFHYGNQPPEHIYQAQLITPIRQTHLQQLGHTSLLQAQQQIPIHLQPIQNFPVSQPHQNLIHPHQYSAPQPTSLATIGHPVMASILNDSTMENHAHIVQKQPQSYHILQNQTLSHEVSIHNGGQEGQLGNDNEVQTSQSQPLPDDGCPMQQYGLDMDPVEDIAVEAMVPDMHPPEVIVSEEPEQDLELWMDRFFSMLQQNFLFNELYRSAFERLRKNVEQNAKTDLAMCSALSNFAKMPLNVGKPNMNIVFEPGNKQKSPGAVSGTKQSGVKFKPISRLTRFQMRSRLGSHLPPKKLPGARNRGLAMERDKFGRWRRSFRRRHRPCQKALVPADEAPGLKEILDAFDTVESEQQREREKEGAEALLQMEARVLVNSLVLEKNDLDNDDQEDGLEEKNTRKRSSVGEAEDEESESVSMKLRKKQTNSSVGEISMSLTQQNNDFGAEGSLVDSSVPNTNPGDHLNCVYASKEISDSLSDGSRLNTQEIEKNTLGAVESADDIDSTENLGTFLPGTGGILEAAAISSQITSIQTSTSSFVRYSPTPPETHDFNASQS